MKHIDIERISKKLAGTIDSSWSGGLLLALILIGLFAVGISSENISEITHEQTEISEEQGVDELDISREGPYQVDRVIDGDTIRVIIDGQSEPVRLIGIDTPEVDSRFTSEECYGAEASARARELMGEREVWLEADPTQDNRDIYDRLLRYVYVDDVNVNQLMIEEGYAFEYTFRRAYRYQGEFIQAQQGARDDRRGLWADETCSGKTTPLSPEVNQQRDRSSPVAEGCIHYSEAPQHIGTRTCVSGVVDHIFTSRSNTTFINYCSDFRTCPFSAVIFSDDQSLFSNIDRHEGQNITLEGVISTHEGRPQIILDDPSQIRN